LLGVEAIRGADELFDEIEAVVVMVVAEVVNQVVKIEGEVLVGVDVGESGEFKRVFERCDCEVIAWVVVVVGMWNRLQKVST